MKKIMFRFISVAALAVFLTGCGQDSKVAAKEAARSMGKLAVTTAADAAAGAVDVAAGAARGAGEAVADEAIKAKDKVVEAAKEGISSAKAKAKEVK